MFYLIYLSSHNNQTTFLFVIKSLVVVDESKNAAYIYQTKLLSMQVLIVI